MDRTTGTARSPLKAVASHRISVKFKHYPPFPNTQPSTMSSDPSNTQHSSSIDTTSASPEALIYAVMSGDVRHVKLLASLNIGVASSDSWVVLEACLHGIEMVHALSCNTHIDLNPTLPGQKGDRVLHLLLRMPSTRFGGRKPETVRILLQKGVDPLEPDRRGNNAIHILSGSPKDQSAQSLRLLQMILCGDQGIPEQIRATSLASINEKNMGGAGNTALIIAVQSENEYQVRLLLEKGASPHVPGEFGRKPLYFAVARDFVVIATLLLDYGATIENDIVALSSEMESLIRVYSVCR
ncbi:hypothetical protein JDV02_003125 [Purpureocillium takamizusanense]|uniref:Ankyrin n=1 Tax=Purpureocillium takamizusanense TaxID=2060973 RepID=A0A9Q8QD42_9HYPO|nr:uncharacterized protein JDV02_003125 [Purpureocillium takamizusanense]UNI16711.1 hypothetical protein JDV02_003125 [Purpureocillium takamizusanense]